MKKILLFISLYFSVAALQAQQQVHDVVGAKFKFKDSNVHDFGNIPMGPQAVCNFEFTNVGTSPLIITGAMASCGCTVPEWPKEPIAPGKSSKITVRFNSAGHPGTFSKTVFVYSNAVTDPPGLVDLHIIGTVVRAGEEKKQ
jgi:hypothetical protein